MDSWRAEIESDAARSIQLEPRYKESNPKAEDQHKQNNETIHNLHLYSKFFLEESTNLFLWHQVWVVLFTRFY